MTVLAQTVVIDVRPPVTYHLSLSALPARILESCLVLLLHWHASSWRQRAMCACLPCCRVLLAYLDVVLSTDELCAWVIVVLGLLYR